MFPRFDGREAWGWLISVEQYCDAKGIAEEKKFSEAEKSLCGDALIWWYFEPGSEPYMPEPRPIPELPEQEKMEENGEVLEKESEANLYVPEPVQELGEEEISAEDDQAEREVAAMVTVGEPDSEAATEKREKIVLVPLMEIRPSTGEMRDVASRVESQKRISQRAGKDDSSADLPQIGAVRVDKESRPPPKPPNPFLLEAKTNPRPPAKPPDLVRAVEVKGSRSQSLSVSKTITDLRPPTRPPDLAASSGCVWVHVMFTTTFPDFHLEDKVNLWAAGNVTEMLQCLKSSSNTLGDNRESQMILL
ncbi:hypothetical protein OROGR_009570 [Orobanche gracilis]